MTALRARIRTDLGGVLAVGLVCLVVVVAAPELVVVRTVLGLPFLLIGVGFCVMRAALGRYRPEPAVQFLLSAGLSIAAGILVGLALYVLGIAFDARSVIAGDCVVAAVAAGVAQRRSGLRGWPVPGGISGAWVAAVLAAVVVFAGAVIALSRPLADGSVAGYTALTAVRTGATHLLVGVDNESNARGRFRLAISGSAVAGRSGATRAIALGPGGRWSRAIEVGPSIGQTIVVTLYRASAPASVLRQVVLRG